MDNHIFRGALNGFNRQDVIAYIEKSQKEASERASALEGQIEDLRRTCAETEQALSASVQERETLTEQLAEQTELYHQIKRDLESECAEKASVRSELCACREELRSARDEADALKDRLQGMENEVASAHQEKERVAQLELEARQRADAVLDEARHQAEEILAQARAEAENTVNKALAEAEDIRKRMECRVEHTAKEYNDLFTSFETVAAHVASELRKMDVMAAQLPINFNHLKDGLAEVLRQAQDRSVTEK